MSEVLAEFGIPIEGDGSELIALWSRETLPNRIGGNILNEWYRKARLITQQDDTKAKRLVFVLYQDQLGRIPF